MTWDWDFGDGSAALVGAEPAGASATWPPASRTVHRQAHGHRQRRSHEHQDAPSSPSRRRPRCSARTRPAPASSPPATWCSTRTRRSPSRWRAPRAPRTATRSRSPQPIAATLFTDGCYTPAPGTGPFDLNGGGGVRRGHAPQGAGDLRLDQAADRAGAPRDGLVSDLDAEVRRRRRRDAAASPTSTTWSSRSPPLRLRNAGPNSNRSRRAGNRTAAFFIPL